MLLVALKPLHCNAKYNIHGDLTFDSTIGISDVSTLIDWLLGGGVESKYVYADVDGDWVVDINDVVVLIDYLLGEIDDWPWLYKGPKLPDSALVFTVNGVSFAMMPVEGCEVYYPLLWPGDTPPSWWANSTYYDKRIRDFYIGQTEVTFELWEAVMGSHPDSETLKTTFDYEPYPLHPVTCVSWYDCQEFIARLNELTGREFHLPNCAQWRYAASGGKWTHRYPYSGSEDADEVAWTVDNLTLVSGASFIQMPVGMKAPNELGLYDMSGNAAEWVYNYQPLDGDVLLPEEYDFPDGRANGGHSNAETMYSHVSGWINATKDARVYFGFRLALQMDE